ncbi:hypothetical protein P43SY_003549 [Pythium insidiosum]|uniref:Sulfite exporter TauE/SafE n=1 Tax=Pythium insidiosum TaxID=114742 RepID=A0AAD5LCY2_PYTIN|nr:hypothetical protein P43SY_003549 [Pythium insidiosum]
MVAMLRLLAVSLVAHAALASAFRGDPAVLARVEPSAEVAVGATARAPFAEVVGLTCSSRIDCGFLPGLACMNGAKGEVLRRCRATGASGASANGSVIPATFCVEKDLFDPFTWSDVVASGLAFVSTALGSGCGVGGGGLLVPAFILVIGLSPKHAIPLSKATIFGNAVAIYWFNFRRKHPSKPTVPIINYSVAAIMEPTTLIGAIFGVMMNHVFPNWLILVLLISLLSYITKRTLEKGRKIRKKETDRKMNLVKSVFKGRTDGSAASRLWSLYARFDWKIAARRWLSVTRRNVKLRQIHEEDREDFQSLPPLGQHAPLSAMTLLDKHEKPGATKQPSADGASPPIGDIGSTAAIRECLERRDASVFPLRLILPLFAAWLVVLLQALLRGGHGVPSVVGVACASPEYWLLTLLPAVVLGLITWRIGYRLRLENRLRVLSQYPFLESDIHWTFARVTRFPIYCINAGIAAGLLGIGGGMVKGPIMLDMGVLPPVQSATASYMILYTASSTTLLFAIAGQFPGSLQYDYVGWFAFVGCLGGFCGQVVVSYLVKKYKRESIVVFLLAGTIGLSALCMGYIGAVNVLRDVSKGTHLGFSSLCGHE